MAEETRQSRNIKISQLKGLRDPNVGVPLSPSALLMRLGVSLEWRPVL